VLLGGAGAAGRFVAAAGFSDFPTLCPGFAPGLDFGFALGVAGARAVRSVTGGAARDVTGVLGTTGVECVACATSGTGADVPLVTGARATRTGTAASGASGLGTGTVDSTVGFVDRDTTFAGDTTFARVGAAVAGAASTDCVVSTAGPGGSSGPGIGIPPAASAAAGDASASAPATARIDLRLSRRDDVHAGTPSLPFESSRYVG
jgi:hypothetical protein